MWSVLAHAERRHGPEDGEHDHDERRDRAHTMVTRALACSRADASGEVRIRCVLLAQVGEVAAEPVLEVTHRCLRPARAAGRAHARTAT
jgi:hypothetical protein